MPAPTTTPLEAAHHIAVFRELAADALIRLNYLLEAAVLEAGIDAQVILQFSSDNRVTRVRVEFSPRVVL